MAEFVYDEMVTAQSLNEIAVDLGAGDFSVFEDGTPYAVGKLNEITQSLVGSGISSALNKFEITVNSENVIVGTGIAFFSSGKKLKLAMPVTLPFKSGELYLYEKLSTGTVSINIGELPIDNYVHLATINEDATYTDRRMIAKAKVELPTEGSSYSLAEMITSGNVNDFVDRKITIPITGAKKIFIQSVYTTGATASFYEYDIEKKSFSGIWFYNVEEAGLSIDSSSICVKYGDGYPYLKINLGCYEQNEETVTFQYGVVRSSSNYTSMENLSVNFYVFGGVER